MLCEQFNNSGYSRRLATIVDFLKPMSLVIDKDMEERPLKKDVVRKPKRVPQARVLQDAIRYQLINFCKSRLCELPKPIGRLRFRAWQAAKSIMAL